MVVTRIGRLGLLLLVLAVVGAACGDGSSDDDHACRTCTVSANCKSDQECVPAVDGELRCFELDKNTCTIDRVPVARATPLPVPTAAPSS